jgi:cytosine/adenosine deaminase-related metal-dependent hydrolase
LAGKYLGSHKGLLTACHVAESSEEARYFEKGAGPIADRALYLNPRWVVPRETTPVQYLNDCGWLPKLDLGIHLNAVKDRDLRLLVKNRISAVHCPGSHAFFGHPPFRYGKFRRHRVPVCLGTDSLASNKSLSLFREMRLFQKENPGVSSHEVLSMATVNPARALGEGNQLGQIRPGFLADLIGIPFSRGRGASRTPQDRVLENRGEVSFAMIHGAMKLRLT